MTSAIHSIGQWLDPRRGPYHLPALAVGVTIAVIVGGTSLLTKIGEHERLTQMLSERNQAVEALHREIASVPPPDTQETARWRAHEEQVQRKLLPDIDSPLLLRSIASLVTGLNNPNIAILNQSQPNPLLGRTAAVKTSSGNDQSLMIKISFQSRYSELIDLLERVAQQERFVEVETLKITRTSPHISVDLVIKAVVIRGTPGVTLPFAKT